MEDKKMKIWNKIDRLIVERDDALMNDAWDKAAKLYIKMSLLIYKNLK